MASGRDDEGGLWKEVDRAWPIRKDRRLKSERQRSYVETPPPYLPSVILRCAECGNAMGQVSGKSGGYYGCLRAATRHACANRLLVRRRLAEGKLVAAIRDRISDPESLHAILKSAAEEVKRLYAHLPENFRLKQASLATEQHRIANFIEFIADGKGTRALGQALEEAEHRATDLPD